MLATRLTCPHCAKQLKIRQAPTAGRRILCNGCNRSFVVSPEAIAATPVPAAVGAVAPVEPTAIQSVSDPAPEPLPAYLVQQTPLPILKPIAPLPAPAPSSEPSAPAIRRGILLGAVVGGLVLLVGATALALLLAVKKDHRTASAPIDPVAAPEDKPRDTRPPSVDEPVTPRDAERPDRPDRPDDAGRPPPAEDVRPRVPDGERPRLETPTEPVSAPDRSWLPREMQQEVNKAIDRGIAFLKKQQLPTGAWENQHTIAYSALPALTLLECGVPASDPQIQKAAKFVRDNHGKITYHHTYELSLALLFLDRLGEAQDVKIIRGIALRLVAGQTPDGGWTYNLPALTTDEENRLQKFLDQTRPQHLDRFVQFPDGQRVDPLVIQRKLDGFVQGQGPDGKPGPSVIQPGSTRPIDGESPKKPPERKKPLTEAEARKLAKSLPPKVANAPAVVDATRKPKGKQVRSWGSDNSNTQFATLALWAASRHGLPLERSLDALAKRFQRTQGDNGTWAYHPVKNAGGGTPAMTGAGLLGLAVGHGLATDTKKTRDAQVEKGFRALAAHVGKPLGADKKMWKPRAGRRGRPVARPVARPLSPINMYFLWTLERVGVLYDARTMDGKDWYRWGVELLLAAQREEGAWQEGGYHGATRTLDSCLALLFLKRANLATDLTKKLEFVIDGKGSLGRVTEGR
jgi:hypothetical protein